MKRRNFAFLSFITAMGFLLFFLLPVSYTAEKLRFGTAVKGNPYHELPSLAAEEQGFWKQNGLEAEWFNFRAGPEVYQALGANSLDLVVIGTTSTLQAMAAGLPLIMVGHSGDDQYFVWVPPDSLLKDPKDLKGTKIGIARLGGAAHAYGRTVVKALGIEKEVKFVAGGGMREEVALLRARKLDARVAGYTTFAKAKYDGVAREFLSIQDYLPREWIDRTLTTRKRFVGGQPETLRRGVKAYLLAARFVKDNKEWTIGKLKSVYGFPEEGAQDVYQTMHFSRDGRIEPKAVENHRNYLIEYGIIAADKIPPAKELFTNEFVR